MKAMAQDSKRCSVCGTRLQRERCFQERLAQNERPNPAYYQYGAVVDRVAIDKHLRAWSVIFE